MTPETPSQWQNLLCNLGIWQGSFTRLSASGELLEDIPTVVTLAGLDENQMIRQTIDYYAPTGEIAQSKQLEYRSLNRSVLFFENGAFSQGSIQLAPFAEFGAELGFIQGNRRLRLVQLFDLQSRLSTITLIREHRQGTDCAFQQGLSVDRLIGDWQGEAVTIYPDWRSPTADSTRLTIERQGERLWQRLMTSQIDIASTAAIDGSILRFDEGSYPRQILLLPDGASSNTPLALPKGKPFFLEAGWLIEDTLRQRMIRSYDAKGGWSSLTLVTERKIT